MQVNFRSIGVFLDPWNSIRNAGLCQALSVLDTISSESRGVTVGAHGICRRDLPSRKHKVNRVPIRPFLAGRPFDPEKISDMSKALEAVCEALRLRMIDDAATRLVAEKIIELAQRGVEGADRLRAMALHELRQS